MCLLEPSITRIQRLCIRAIFKLIVLQLHCITVAYMGHGARGGEQNKALYFDDLDLENISNMYIRSSVLFSTFST